MDKPEELQRYLTQTPNGAIQLHITRAHIGGYDCGETQRMTEELLRYYQCRVTRLLDRLEEQNRELTRLKKEQIRH